MALSYDLKEGDGTTKVFPFNFAGLGKGYLVPANLRVELRTLGTEDWYRTDDWTLVTTNSLSIEHAPPFPSDGKANIRIRRVMPKEEPYTDWKVGQNYSDYMINNSFLTQLYICHEILDGFFETEGGSIDFTAGAILFDPRGTDYSINSDNVDKVLREIDQTFIRKGSEPVDPDPDDGTDLQPNTVWLVDASVEPRSRYLPTLEEEIPESARILIRDDKGAAQTHNITIKVKDGVTIMDKEEDLTINEDWSWVELVYLGEGKWHIAAGGVGSQIEPDRAKIVEAAYPVKSIYLTTTNINPNIILGAGIWKQICRGRALMGEGISTDEAGRSFTVLGGKKFGNTQTVLTERHIPKHQFTYQAPSGGGTRSGTGGSRAFKNNWTTKYTEYYGASNPEPITTVQPSFGIYVWERVG